MDLFIDRSRWPELIRSDYERTTEALKQSRRRPSGSINGSIPASPAPQQAAILRRA